MPLAKKRRVEQNGGPSAAASAQDVKGFHKGSPEKDGELLFEMPDVSFMIPVRKKLKLEVWSNGLCARDEKTGEGQWYLDRNHARKWRAPAPDST